ncbi:hypothetical protein ACOMHN_007757 [Nucella lapillus]
MASGFVSSVVRRLFPGKSRDKTPRADPRDDRSPTPSKDHPPSSPTSPSFPSSSYSPSSASSPSSPSSTGAKKQSKSKDQDPKAYSDTPVKKRQPGKRKSPLFSSLRKKTRPLSCIASRSDSPPPVLLGADPQSPTDHRTPKQRGKKEEEKSASKQRRENKSRRPLSCIVQPPSPQLLPSVDHSPELLPRTADGNAVSDRKEDRPQAAKNQPRPRPVSCFVETPAGRSPPPYFRRTPAASPQIPQSPDQYAQFQVGSPQRYPLSYLEASRRSPRLSPQPQQVLEGRSSGRPISYHAESCQQSAQRYTDNASVMYYSEQLQEPVSPYPEPFQQPVEYPVPCPEPYPAQSPRQSSPVIDNRPPLERSGRCGNVNCFLDPCPYQYSAQPQTINGYTYDLQTYFPPATSARRYARPQSACFLCEPRPCCVEARGPCRPKSQGFFPDCDPPWADSNPSLNMEHQIQQMTFNAPSEKDPAPQAKESESSPRPSTPAVVQTTFEQTPVSPETSCLLPRPAKRTLAPRPKSSYILSTESDCSPMSSPAPSPRPRRFPLRKYRSADCLDRVDEVESLDVSPPPAKPLSYFTDTDNPEQTTGKNKDGIFTSAEMLEKLGQPRARSNQSRPVSCFVGSSADESGYLSNATLGGSGWLGGLSASTGDILEMLQDREELTVADDELSFERASSFRKAWSVCSLLRQDSIQDRSFTVMRRRRQKMKDRRHTNQRSSSTETDEGVGDKERASDSSLLEKCGRDGESDTVAGIPLDKNFRGSRGAVMRLHSVHMKAWQVRLRRKQMMKKRRSTERLDSRIETLV